jgi:macrolide transport system ATP-binding/permease protein
MTSLFRKVTWWVLRRRKEDELREELEFHLANEADERQADGLTEDQARWAARRDLGNVTLLREDTRTLWTWTPVEQLAQDLRYALRVMVKNRAFTALAALSLALGIGANAAIYSFMDAILLRSLPVSDPASLVVVKWRSRGIRSDFVMHSVDGASTTTPRARRRVFFRSQPLSACRRHRHRFCPASSRTNWPAT